jgi:hypothetical protein
MECQEDAEEKNPSKRPHRAAAEKNVYVVAGDDEEPSEDEQDDYELDEKEQNKKKRKTKKNVSQKNKKKKKKKSKKEKKYCQQPGHEGQNVNANFGLQRLVPTHCYYHKVSPSNLFRLL